MTKADQVPPDGTAVAVWRQLITDDTLSWVLFENGTVVVLRDPAADVLQRVFSIMQEWGQTPAGVPSGDYTVMALPEDLGWVVTSHFLPAFDLLTYVNPQELPSDNPTADAVGQLGQRKRGRDATELVVVHIEDRGPLRK